MISIIKKYSTGKMHQVLYALIKKGISFSYDKKHLEVEICG